MSELLGILDSDCSIWRHCFVAVPNHQFKILIKQKVFRRMTFFGMVAARVRYIIDALDLSICDTDVGATMNFVLVALQLTLQITLENSVLVNSCSTMSVPKPSPVVSQNCLKKCLRWLSIYSPCGFQGSYTTVLCLTSVTSSPLSLRLLKATGWPCSGKDCR